MVQIGVPLQSRELYGKPQFMPLWEAAARRGLPVAVHIETGNGIGYPPTPSGHPRTYPQYAGFMGLNYLYHLMSLITEGVFEALPDLKIVWADGGAEMLTPFMWRMDTFGRPHLEQTPWAPRSRARTSRTTSISSTATSMAFVRPAVAAEWLEMTGKSDMIMYGSSYPHWSMTDVELDSHRLTDAPASEDPLAERRQALRPWPGERGPATNRLRTRSEHMAVTSIRERRPSRRASRSALSTADVHPVPRAGELFEYIPEPYRSRVLEAQEVGRYQRLRRAGLRPRAGDAPGLVPGRTAASRAPIPSWRSAR